MGPDRHVTVFLDAGSDRIRRARCRYAIRNYEVPGRRVALAAQSPGSDLRTCHLREGCLTIQAERGLTRPQDQAQRRKRRRARRRWHYLLMTLLTGVTVIVVLAAVSVVGGLRTRGNENFKAKWADWLRSHHASFVVNPVERWYYTEKAPAPGGRPVALNAVPGPEPSPAPTVEVPVQAAPQPTPGHLTRPAPVPLIVFPALVVKANGKAAARSSMEARPCTWPSIERTRRTQARSPRRCGLMRPRCTFGWSQAHKSRAGPGPSPPISAGAAATAAVAAFNGGFRFQDAHGGFFLDGRVAVPLRSGAASMVIYDNGSVDIGRWGTQVAMGPHVHAVLQNLVPLVDNGQTAPDATYTDTHLWGSTLGANTVVARSGIGVTGTGALIYVAGPALTARSLAEALQRAGAVRAMALDINPYWVTFNLYDHPDPANPSQITPRKLYPEMTRAANRYLGPMRESRDFFTVSID